MRRWIFLVLSVLVIGLHGCEDGNNDESVNEEPVFKDMYLTHGEVEEGDVDEGDVHFPNVEPLSMDTTLLDEYEDELLSDLPFEEGSYDFHTDQSTALLNIEVDNPEDLPITRFTLNGTNYFIGDYQQHTGGLIQMEVDIDLSKETNTFSLDEMLYLDQRPVEIEGNTEITAAITRDEYPQIGHLTIRDESHDGAEFNIHFEGNRFDEGSALLRAAVFNDGELVTTRDVVDDSDSFTLEGLPTNETYSIAFLLVYDMLDGEGMRLELVEDYSVSPEPYVTIDEVSEDLDSVKVSLDEAALEGIGDITRVMIEQSDTMVEQYVNPDDFTFEGLHSGSDYTLFVEYEYELDGTMHTDTVETEFSTPSPVEPEGKVKVLEEGYHRLEMSPIFNDIDEIGVFDRMDVYRDGEHIESVRDTDGTILAEDLHAGETLDVFVHYTYDALDGKGEQSVEEHFEVTTEEYITPSFNVIDETADHHGFTLESVFADPDDLGEVTSVDLLLDGEVVDTVDYSVEMIFDELLAGTQYDVRLNYDYDPLDGDGVREGEDIYTVETEVYTTPKVTFDDIETSHDTITVNGTYDDPDAIGTMLPIQLLDGEDVLREEIPDVVTGGAFEVAFDALHSGETYTVKTGSEYDALDGEGSQIDHSEESVETDTLSEPSVEGVSTEELDSDSFSFSLAWEDPDNLVTVEDIVLEKEGEEVTRSDDLTFEDLDPDTLYTVDITYAYDLNDGKGNQVGTHTFEQRTNPYVGLKSMTIPEDGMLIEYGEPMTIEFMLDNPSGLSFDTVDLYQQSLEPELIGDETYVVTFTPTRNDVEPGIQTLETGVMALSDEDTYEFRFDLDTPPEFNLYTEPEVDAMHTLDTSFKKIRHVPASAPFIVEIAFDNPSEVSIDKVLLDIGTGKNEPQRVEVTSEDFTMSDDRQSAFLNLDAVYASSDTGMLIEMLSFSIDGEEVLTPNEFIPLSINRDSNIRKVSTPDDLQDMEDGYVYRLTQDINMQGYDWSPYEFNAYLDGDGYTISNLTVDDQAFEGNKGNTHLMGMFTTIRYGAVYDITLSNFDIDVTMENQYDTSEYFLNVGTLAGWMMENSRIENVTVVNSSINSVHNMEGHSYLGGLSGSIRKDALFRNIHVEADIIGENGSDEYSVRAGGLVGISSPDDSAKRIKFNEVYFSGTITNKGMGETGGLIANMHETDVQNAKTDVDLDVSPSGDYHYGIGGMFGYINNSSVENAYAVGSLNLTQSQYHSMNGLSANNQGSSIRHAFSLVKDANGDYLSTLDDARGDREHVYSVVSAEAAIVAPIEDILEHMQDAWDETVWDFEENVDSGLPTLSID